MLALCSATSAWAQQHTFDIPAEDANKAIPEFARQAGIQIVAPGDQLKGVQTPAVKGNLDRQVALSQLLAGTGTKVASDDGQTVVLTVTPKNVQAAANDAAAETGLRTTESVIVTGTHIRGSGPVGSPVNTYDRQAIDTSGAITIEQFAQKMTENLTSVSPVSADFANTSSGLGQTGTNAYAGSSFNLHGTGPGATLTLLDGHRVSAGGANGQFVDVSLIPLSAVDRIEVLDDGGSAIYGSDAIAGVVNVVLKKDFDGASTSLRLFNPTDGGGQELNASQLLGKSWGSGNIMAVYEYDNQDAIGTSQRSFVPTQVRAANLTPNFTKQSVLLSAHQELFDPDTVLDGLAYFGSHHSNFTFNTASSLSEYSAQMSKVYGGAVSIDHKFSGGWNAGITGNYSKSQGFVGDLFPALGVKLSNFSNILLRESEIHADGPLLDMGTHTLQGAFGAGVRTESLWSNATSIPSRLQRNISYLYGELQLPLILPSENVPFAENVAISAAGRFDHYSKIGSSTNPKVGLSWLVVPGVSLRGSYSTAFKVPYLDQLSPAPQYYTRLEPNSASTTGFTDVLVNQSAHNPALQPEKAATVSAGIDLEPQFLEGSQMSLTYFETNYKNRIATPPFVGNVFAGTAAIFQQPALTSFINTAPTLSAVQALFTATGFVSDFAGGGPTAVKAIFNDQLTNLANTDQSGIEATAHYTMQTDIGSVLWSFAGTYYLQNSYLATATATSVSLLNVVGQPLRLKIRGGATWTNDAWSSSLFVNFANSYLNPVFAPAQNVSAWTTVDWQLSYHMPDLWGFTDQSGFKLALDVQNVFDEAPPFIAVPKGLNNVGFDPLNASPIGRAIAISITKEF